MEIVEARGAASPLSRPAATLPDRIRLPLAFDPLPLVAELAALASGEWTDHFVRQNYDGDWAVLPLRAAAGAVHPVMMIYANPTARDFVDTPFLARLPACSAAIAAFRCPVRAARLMRLGAGSRIKEHDDLDLDADLGWARIHIPILTNPGVTFLLNRSPVVMAPGEAWYLRLSDPHSVDNRGETDRIHLVIDLQVNDWLAAQLSTGAASAAAQASSASA